MEYDKSVSGVYLNPATAVTKFLSLPFQPDWYEACNIGTSLATGTAWYANAATGAWKQVKWYRGMNDDTALGVFNVDNQYYDVSKFIATAGITPYSSNPTLLGTAKSTGGAIARGTPVSTVTLTAHGYATGDVVLLRGTVGMLQVSGIPYRVTRTGADTFTITVDSTGLSFAADATACVAQKVLYPDVYQPDIDHITGITAANPAVVTFARYHTYAIGDEVRFIIPAGWGMVQLDGMKGFVTATSVNTITVAINTSAMTAFTYPTSASAATGITFPQVVPIGEIASSFAGSFQDYGTQGLILGTSAVGIDASYVAWRAGVSAKVYTP